MANTPRIRFKGFTDDWEQRKLGEVIKVCNGRDYKHLDVGKIPVYGTGGYMLSVSEALSYKDDSIGIGRKGTIDRPYILKAPFWTVDTLFYCIPKQNNDLKFIFSVFQNVDWKSMDESTGVPSLSKAAINKVNILTPNILEQVKIGTYFSALDHLITLHQRECDETKKLKKFMLQKMFPKNGEKNPEIRFAGFTDDWEQRKLGEIVEFLDTMRKPLEEAKRVPGPYPYYGASGIVDYVEDYIFDEELVLLSEDGANITDRNYPVCFLASGKYWVNNHAHVLRTKNGHENNFICNSLERKDYNQYNSGMAMPKLNKEECRSIPVSCPSCEEQKRIGDYFRNLDHLITLHQRKCDKLKLIKKFMLQNMFPQKG